MDCVIVASTAAHAGKTSVVAALLAEASARGLRAGYLKPLGAPDVSHGVELDPDAAFLASLASAHVGGLSEAPVLLDDALVARVLAGEDVGARAAVRAAYESLAARTDVVFIEGPRDLAEGSALGLDLGRLAELLCGRVVLVARPAASDIPEDVLFAHDTLGERLAGVLFNDVPEDRASGLSERTVPFLTERGIRILGLMAHDRALASVSVRDIAETLTATVLTASEHLDTPVETFIVGAMGQQKALAYFRRLAHKAVVTGGDRSDVLLAALETDTRCVVCTGDLVPAAIVLSRAEELGVPVLLVGMDTLSAVERIEALFASASIHDRDNVARMREMLSASVDLDAFFASLA